MARSLLQLHYAPMGEGNQHIVVYPLCSPLFLHVVPIVDGCRGSSTKVAAHIIVDDKDVLSSLFF
jgi:hypothetical protein